MRISYLHEAEIVQGEEYDRSDEGTGKIIWKFDLFKPHYIIIKDLMFEEDEYTKKSRIVMNASNNLIQYKKLIESASSWGGENW